MEIKIKKLNIKYDERGLLAEILRQEDMENTNFGQIIITTANHGQTKGEHYHKRKTEWYCVIKGKGLLSIVDNQTREKSELSMGEGNMVTVMIPPNHYHSIKNTGKDEMYLLAYVDEAFNPKDPDTYSDKT